MTGYGRGQHQGYGKQISVEMRSVNHRFLEIAVRLPRQYNLFEEKIKDFIRERVARGRFDVYLNIEDTADNKRYVKVDKDLAIAYHKSLKELGEILQIPSDIGLLGIFQLPDVFSIEEEELDLELFWNVVEKATAEALQSLLQMREIEGEKLAKSLDSYQEKLRQMAKIVESRSEHIVNDYRDRLEERIKSLMMEIPIDEQRIALEIAMMAEKSDITEELTRLYSHLAQLSSSLEMGIPVGRKLEFIVQELNREVNTIGSKANDLEISQLVVEMKSELEKIREQVQNLE